MNQIQVASMKVLYEEIPIISGDSFIQIRQWETGVDEQTDLIVDYGQLDETGELQTYCQVMPFFKSVEEVLTEIKL